MFDALRTWAGFHNARTNRRSDAAVRTRHRPYARGAAVAVESLERRMFLTATMGLLGNGNAISSGSTTVSHSNFTDYGYVDVPSAAGGGNLANAGSSVTRLYTITNTGDTALSINLAGSTITGPNYTEFQVTTLPAVSIDAGSSTTFVVTFTPLAPGTRSATIKLATNDPAHQTYSFTVSGQGLAVYVFQNSTGTATGLKGAITQSGTGTLASVPGQEMRVTYNGYLFKTTDGITDGLLFDSSSLHAPGTFDFALSTGQVIPGWDQGLQNMRIGEKRVLIIPPSLGYGDTANGNIPAGSTLVFEVQLVAIVGPTLQVAGQGIPIANGDTSPSITDDTSFGAVLASATVTHTFTITATSAGSLSFTGNPEVQLSGTNANQFSITQPVVDSGGTFATFTVTFQPTAIGSYSAIVTLPNNDPQNSNYHFTVAGSEAVASDLSGYFANTINIPSIVAAGDKYNVPLTITNSGPGKAAGTVKITVEASVDGAWHDGVPVLGTIASQTLSIAANGSSTFTVPITIPANSSLALGNYTLVAKIQVLSGIAQDGGQNNVVNAKGSAAGPAVPVNVVATLPDLTVSFGSLGPIFANYVPGDTITLPVLIHNTGVASAVGTTLAPIIVDVRSSLTSDYDPADALISELVITSSIARGATVTKNVTVKIPSTISPSAIYAVASADTTNVVTELNESNNTVSTAGTINVLWQFGTVSGRSSSVPLTLTDADGTIVKLQLSGRGTGSLVAGGNGFDITLLGTTTASTLNITTTKSSTPGDDGRFGLDSLTVGDTLVGGDQTSIGTINARTTDLGGNLTITGAAGAINWGNIAGQHSLSIGSPADAPLTPPSVKLTFGSVQNLTLTSAIGISSLTATSWTDTDPTADSITAPWLSNLSITGSTSLALAGDFMANLSLTAATGATATSPTLGNVSIAGSVGATTWSITGKAGALTIKGTVGTLADAWQLQDLTSATTITLGDVTSAIIDTTGSIGTLSSKRWLDGSITATTIGTLKALGQTGTSAFAGDFTADLNLAGPATTPTGSVLGTATIAGSCGAGKWDVTGKVGTITINGTVGTAGDEWYLDNITGATTITLGDVTDATINSTGAIGTLSSKRWLDGSITATTIGTLKTLGLTGVFTGDFAASLTLTGPAGTSTSSVLSTASIAGSVGATTWSIAGKVGSLTINGTVGTLDDAWQLQDLTSASTLTLGDVTNATISTTGSLGTVSSKRWLDGSISAATISTLKTLGQTGLTPFTGDFAADLTLTGPASKATSPLLGTVSIANHIMVGNWNIAGAMTNLTAKAIEPTWHGTFTGASGNIASLKLTDAAINSTLNITANAIASITLAGGLVNSTMTLSQSVSLTQKALGTLTVAGDITGSDICTAGNIGSVKARSLNHTQLLAGVPPEFDSLPASAADFVDANAANLPTIASLTLTGFPLAPATAIFGDSDVAAGKITTVKFLSTDAALIDASGVSANFGFATRLGVTTYTGPVSAGFYISGADSIVS